MKFIHFKVGQLDENQIDPTPEFPLLQFPCGKKTGVKVYFDFFPPSKSIERTKTRIRLLRRTSLQGSAVSMLLPYHT
ncbi:MAG: hypothetical protein ACI9O5_001787, partial [Algoriphagus sp.]